MSSNSEFENLDVQQILVAIKNNFKQIIYFTFLCILVGIILFSLRPNLYQSSSVLATNNDSSSQNLSNLQSQYGGLASLAGVDISGSSGGNKSAYCEKLLLSKDFFEKILDKDMLIDLVGPTDASIFYSKESTNIFKNKIFERAHINFLKVFNIDYDTKIDFFELSYSSPNTNRSKDTLIKIISKINLIMKEIDVKEANQLIIYLEDALISNQMIDTKAILGSLLLDAHKTIALSESRSEYFLKVIESPRESYKSLKASLIVHLVASIFFGIFFGIFSVLLFKPFK